MAKIVQLSVASLLLAAVALPPRAEAAPCEGRCEDATGAVRVVGAGECAGGEVCRAGCDTSGPGAPRPYAECRSSASGEMAVRPVLAPPGGRRTRQDDHGSVVE